MSKEGSNSGKVLAGFLGRVERLRQEQAVLGEDIKAIKAEAKAQGFDMPTFNEMLKLRKLDQEKRQEKEELRDMYITALDLI